MDRKLLVDRNYHCKNIPKNSDVSSDFEKYLCKNATIQSLMWRERCIG